MFFSKRKHKWKLRFLTILSAGVAIVAQKTKPWWRGEPLDLAARQVNDMATRQMGDERRVGFDRAQQLEDQRRRFGDQPRSTP